MTRKNSTKPTKSNLNLVELFLNAMDAKVAAVEVERDRFRIITTDGGSIDSEASLDIELDQYRKRRG